MPTFVVTSPDGKKYRVNAPEGSTQQDAVAYIKEQQGVSAPASFDSVQSSVSQSEKERSPGEMAGLAGRSVARGLGGMADFGEMIAKVSPGALPMKVAKRLSGLPDDIDFRGKADELADRAQLPTPRNATERVVSGVGEALTGAATTGGIGGLAKFPFLYAKPVLQATSTATGAVSGELARESGASPAQQFAANIVGGMLPGQPLGRGARAASHPEKDKIIALGKEHDVPLRPTAFGGGIVEFLRGQPFVGAAKNYTSDVAQFNRQLNRAIGIDEPILTKPVYAKKMASLDEVKNEILDRNEMLVDTDLVSQLGNIQDQARVSGPDEARIIKNIIETQIAGRVDADTGAMSARAYKKLEETLASSGGKAETHIYALKKVLADAMERSMSPEDVAAFRKWRQEFGDLKSLETLVAKGRDSYLDPKELMNAYTTNTFNQRGRMASGRRGKVGEFAELGQYINKPAASVAARAPSALPMGAALTTLMIQRPDIGVGLLTLSHLAGRAAESPRLTRLMGRKAREATRAKAATASALGTAQAANVTKNKNSGGGR